MSTSSQPLVSVVAAHPHRLAVLRADHEALEALTQSVMKRVVEGNRAGVAEAVAELQTRVGAHLDAEEGTLVKGYAVEAPADAAEIMLEHGKIRDVLASLDVKVDLHLVRADVLEAFLARLRAHAAREDAGLYKWAAQQGAT